MSMRISYPNTFNVRNLQVCLDATKQTTSKRSKINRSKTKKIEHKLIRSKLKQSLYFEINKTDK
jgi:hypothetical protein